LVVETGPGEIVRHFGATAKLVDELLIKPRLVDAKLGVDEQTVAIEALDVVPLVCAAIAPDVDAVFLHRRHPHRAGDSASDRRRVEVGDTGGGDMECTALERG